MAKFNNDSLKDRNYRLMKKAAPLSFMIPTRNTSRFPLLYFDEELKRNRALRYGVNQRSVFEDEQDGNVLSAAIIFENGFLHVPKTKPELQEFLFYHPMNGKVFSEVNEEKDAEATLAELDRQFEAEQKVRDMAIDQLEILMRAVIGKKATTMSSNELKRDARILAKRDPKRFLAVMEDPDTKIQSSIQIFFDNKLLALRASGKEVWLNLPTVKRKLATVPYGSDAMTVTVSYLKSEQGLEVLQMLESSTQE